jgi:hypothetical protein
MNFADFVMLVQVIAWPIVVVVVVLIFRPQLPKIVQALGGRISRLEAVGVTLEFSVAEPTKETLRVLDEIKEPSSTGPPPPSGVPSLLELSETSRSADYLVIDLREGMAWLTSRLYLFAVVLSPVLALRCFVFVGTRDSVPRYFLGLASPESVSRALERRFPWLRKVMVQSQLQPIFSGQAPNRYVAWSPYGDTDAALKRLIKESAPDKWERLQAEALEEIVTALISPIDLFQPGQVETFVKRFLENPIIRRPHKESEQDQDWVQLKTVDEHARWIKNERYLLDLIDGDLSREHIIANPTTDDEVLEKAVLRKRGNFVAVTDMEGRFDRLIDRAALLERVAAGKNK